MGLGLRLAQDLDFYSNPVHAHVVIGLLVTLTLILFQPLMGYLQHRHFHKYHNKSVFAYVHRWIGRSAIILGITNSGLGFQLARDWGGVIIDTESWVRNYVLAGFFLGLWVSLILWDAVRARRTKKVGDGGEKATETQSPRSETLR
jgi:hypothetical protein